MFLSYKKLLFFVRLNRFWFFGHLNAKLEAVGCYVGVQNWRWLLDSKVTIVVRNHSEYSEPVDFMFIQRNSVHCLGKIVGRFN